MMDSSCPQCNNYQKEVARICREYSFKFEALQNDNNILKCQMDKLLISTNETSNLQNEINKLKSRIDLLLKANENHVREIQRLQNHKLYAKVDEGGDGGTAHLQQRIYTMNKKYHKLENDLDRERKLVKAFDEAYHEMLHMSETIKEENIRLRGVIESLEATLTAATKPETDLVIPASIDDIEATAVPIKFYAKTKAKSTKKISGRSLLSKADNAKIARKKLLPKLQGRGCPEKEGTQADSVKVQRTDVTTEVSKKDKGSKKSKKQAKDHIRRRRLDNERINRLSDENDSEEELARKHKKMDNDEFKIIARGEDDVRMVGAECRDIPNIRKGKEHETKTSKRRLKKKANKGEKWNEAGVNKDETHTNGHKNIDLSLEKVNLESFVLPSFGELGEGSHPRLTHRDWEAGEGVDAKMDQEGRGYRFNTDVELDLESVNLESINLSSGEDGEEGLYSRLTRLGMEKGEGVEVERDQVGRYLRFNTEVELDLENVHLESINLSSGQDGEKGSHSRVIHRDWEEVEGVDAKMYQEGRDYRFNTNVELDLENVNLESINLSSGDDGEEGLHSSVTNRDVEDEYGIRMVVAEIPEIEKKRRKKEYKRTNSKSRSKEKASKKTEMNEGYAKEDEPPSNYHKDFERDLEHVNLETINLPSVEEMEEGSHSRLTRLEVEKGEGVDVERDQVGRYLRFNTEVELDLEHVNLETINLPSVEEMEEGSHSKVTHRDLEGGERVDEEINKNGQNYRFNSGVELDFEDLASINLSVIEDMVGGSTSRTGENGVDFSSLDCGFGNVSIKKKSRNRKTGVHRKLILKRLTKTQRRRVLVAVNHLLTGRDEQACQIVWRLLMAQDLDGCLGKALEAVAVGELPSTTVPVVLEALMGACRAACKSSLIVPLVVDVLVLCRAVPVAMVLEAMATTLGDRVLHDCNQGHWLLAVLEQARQAEAGMGLWAEVGRLLLDQLLAHPEHRLVIDRLLLAAERRADIKKH